MMKFSRNELSIDNYCIKEIFETMNYFDFEKVHKVMEFLNWGWWHDENAEHNKVKVPSIEEIRRKAFELLCEVAEYADNLDEEMTDRVIGTGGFEAKIFLNEDDMPEFELKFVLESV